MEYPEEIYTTCDGGTMFVDYLKDTSVGWGRRHAYEVGYEAGKAEATDPLAGYSNLTAAIKAGDPIDWERLDGMKIKCVHPVVGKMRGTLKRDPGRIPERPWGWLDESMDEAYTLALIKAWYGESEWSLYVEGEVPLRRKTADELELYTYFLGQVKGDSPYLAYVGNPLATDTEKTIYYAPEMLKSINPAADWVVLEEYGPFQKPEDK